MVIYEDNEPYALRLKSYTLNSEGELDWVVFEIMNVAEDDQLERIKRVWTEGRIKPDLSLLDSASFKAIIPITYIPEKGYFIEHTNENGIVKKYSVVRQLIRFVQDMTAEYYLLKDK